MNGGTYTRQKSGLMGRSDLAGQAELTLPNEAESLAKRKAAEPLRPEKEQRPCDIGLFSDEANQIDLEDLL